ncbi:Gfo/Idh/MocA family protein [Paenibacillus koleovorans]|uniref:Gfo/Idh/MocA family protein n=1 Tax=Paenibacillus koleovorans TaxID=121608 RepID=UPI000FDC6EF7|nr:Gfo/Idh/MocA family oxidoreductase [Paenibacillus koleovorans]
MNQQHKKRVRFAVVGCGAIAKSHLTGIEMTDIAELTAVCDADPGRAAEYAGMYGVRAYTDYAELLADEEVDAVCLCTPSGMHAEQTMQAARAGKHVVSEKPMAIVLDDAHRMIEACEANGVKLTTIFPRRMTPTSQFAKKLLDEGRLGRLSLCSGYVKFYREQAYYDRAGWRGTWAMDGGGAMMNQGIHTIDLLQWLAGPVVSLQAYARNVLRRIEVEDTAVVSLQFCSGALGSIEATTTAYKQPLHQITIHGEYGTLILTDDEITTLEVVGDPIELPALPSFSLFPDGHAAQIRDMAHAILEDRAPFVSGKDGLHSLEIILGAYKSQQQAREIVF